MKLNRVETIIYDILLKQRKPLSAYDILELIRGEGVKSPPLVYRALKKLTTNHLAHRLEALNRYIACRDHTRKHQHHFFICQDCHYVFEDDSTKLRLAVEESAHLNEFLAKRSIIEVLGICAKCQA